MQKKVVTKVTAVTCGLLWAISSMLLCSRWSHFPILSFLDANQLFICSPMRSHTRLWTWDCRLPFLCTIPVAKIPFCCSGKAELQNIVFPLSNFLYSTCEGIINDGERLWFWGAGEWSWIPESARNMLIHFLNCLVRSWDLGQGEMASFGLVLLCPVLLMMGEGITRIGIQDDPSTPRMILIYFIFSEKSERRGKKKWQILGKVGTQRIANIVALVIHWVHCHRIVS